MNLAQKRKEIARARAQIEHQRRVAERTRVVRAIERMDAQ